MAGCGGVEVFEFQGNISLFASCKCVLSWRSSVARKVCVCLVFFAYFEGLAFRCSPCFCVAGLVLFVVCSFESRVLFFCVMGVKLKF